jgi:hypothetical protein
MIDENDPVVRAVQAPFDVSMGEYQRRITDANAQYQQDIQTIQDKIKEREEKLKEQQAAGMPPEVRELLAASAGQQQSEAPKRAEWDYDNPLPDEQVSSRAWSSATAPQAAAVPPPVPPPYAPPRHQAPSAEPAWDYSDPLSASEQPAARHSWSEPVAEPPTHDFAAPVAPSPTQPPAPPRRQTPARHADPADDDYSSESWLQ